MVFLIISFTIPISEGMSAQEQKFTVYPDSVEVNEGDDVFLSCIVQNQQGKAQWTKDGFALGFERDVPGYPRYSYSGDSEKGEHHLVIHGITLEDDGEYQCQVGPTAKTSALWASANVTVMVSPSSISILGGIDGEPVVAVADKQLRIQCLVKEARPAPSVAWYRNGIMLDQNTHTERAEPSTQFKRWNVRSRLTLTPKPEDDGQQFSCRALHPSLMNSPTSLVASVTLSVLHLPEPPVISGYKTGEILKEGQDITLTCKCQGGNPRPRLGWYKNGKLLNHPNTTYTKATKENDFVKSSLALQVKAEDDRATFECRVTKNDILNHPLSDNVTFTVHYSPKRVFVTGPSVATAGEEFTLTCVTSKSNPSAAINWLVHGMQVATVASLISETDDGGWVTSSDLKYYLDRSLALSEITVDCTAHNPASDRMVSESHVISIIKPPGRPFIKVEGAGEVVAGGRMAIICTSEGGNPHPGITIYKGHTKLLTKVVIDGRVTRARAITDVVASDNGIKVSCEVANPAIRAPLVAHTKVKLLFPPWEVSAWVSPAHVDAGQVISLVCESTSSLPPSRVSWRSGPLMLHGATSSQSPGLYGGTVTKSVLEVRALIEDNGRVFTCDANNGLGTTVTTNVTLNVLHGPIWVTVPTGTIEVQEKDDLILTAAANANPPPVSYTWWRGPLKIEGLSSSDGEDTEGRLEIRRIHRQEAGAYSVTATSPRGRVNASFIINILYGPESVLASKRVTVDEDGSTSVLCSAVGNPAPNVTWFRQDQYSTREILTWGINEARLPIQYASRSDTGFYYCLASNVVATSAPVKTAVVVTQAPEPPGYEDGQSELEFRWWANVGGTGSLECTVGAAPAPNFRWSIDGERVLFNNRKYFIRRPKLLDDLAVWSSVLEVRNVTVIDYKTYICKATNSRGTYTANHTLGPPVPPLQPLKLNVSSVMGSTAILSWLPPSKGTSPSGYSLKYRPLTGNKYTFIDAVGSNLTTATIQGLTPGTGYEVMIQSFNDQGRSPFALPPTHFTVPGVEEEVASSSSQPRVPRLTLLLMSLTGAALLVLNISIIICFFKRFTKMRRTSNSYKACYTPASTPGITTDEEDRTGSSDIVSSPSHYQMACQNSQRREDEEEEEEEDVTLTVHHIRTEPPASLKPPENPLLSGSSLEKLPAASSPCRNYNSALMNGGLSMQRGRSSTPKPETVSTENLKETIVEWTQEATQLLDDNISRRMKVSGHQPDIPDVCPKTPGPGSSTMPSHLSMEMTCLEEDRISVASHYSNTSYVNLHDQTHRLGRNTPMSQRHQDNPSPPLALMPSTPVRVPSLPSAHDLSAKCSMTGKMQQHEASAPPCCSTKPTSQVIYHGQPHIQQQHEQQQYQEHLQHLEQHHHHQHHHHHHNHHHHHLDHQQQSQQQHPQATAHHQHDHFHHPEPEQHQDQEQHLAQRCQTDYHYLHPNYGQQPPESHQEMELEQSKQAEQQEMLPACCSNSENREFCHQMPCCDDHNLPSHRPNKYYEYQPIPQSYSPQPPEPAFPSSTLYRSHSLPRKKRSYNPSPQRHHSAYQRRPPQFPSSYDPAYPTHSRKGSYDPYGTMTHSQSEHQYPVPFTDMEYTHSLERPAEEYPLRPIRKEARHELPRYSELDPSTLYAKDATYGEGGRRQETTFDL